MLNKLSQSALKELYMNNPRWIEDKRS